MGKLDVAGATVKGLAIFALSLLSMGHVGSPDTFFAGHAGPYPVQVSVRLPGVIPGLARIDVRVSGDVAKSVRGVAVQAIQWNVGPEGAPPPDPATSVPGDASLYTAELWFMVATSYRVSVVIDGDAGRASVVVPVLALATAQRTLGRGSGSVLMGLGILLSAGLVTIVGAAVRESVLAPGLAPDSIRRRRGRIGMAVTAVLVLLALLGGGWWWDAEKSFYGERILYRPFTSDATSRIENGRRMLTLKITDNRWPPSPSSMVTRYNLLMPDHGKLMHMFLVREPSLDVFAHVHPVPREPAGVAFDLLVPPIPPGRYRVYGDIVHESGYAQTLMASTEIPAALGGDHPATPDPDDSWMEDAAAPQAPDGAYRFADGSTITWEQGSEPLVAGKQGLLKFVARDAGSAPIPLESYMGMLGHVAVTTQDGSVFAHLHPSGSVSMAALQKFGSPAGLHMAHGEPTNVLSIPYAFPKPDPYRVWVQIKHRGEILTAAFDAQVRPSNP